MSLWNEVQVSITLADFANTDSIGKLNVIGGGGAFLMQQPDGMWPPLVVALVVDVPGTYSGTDFALSMELHDITLGKVVQLPGPDGKLQPLRVQQAVTVATVQVPPQYKRPVDATVQHVMVMNFPTGLPLVAGSSYEWRTQIDGQSTKHWRRRFHALGPAPGAVIGGPFGPITIPGVTPPHTEE